MIDVVEDDTVIVQFYFAVFAQAHGWCKTDVMLKHVNLLPDVFSKMSNKQALYCISTFTVTSG